MKRKIKNGEFLCGDCISLMKELKDNSVDLIICDLPYGVTGNDWDIIIDKNLLWEQYLRIIKNNCAVILTAQQPFTSELVLSNLSNFRYSYVWVKNTKTDFLNSKNRPMRRHEDVLVFSKNSCRYYPQELVPCVKLNKRAYASSNYGQHQNLNNSNFTNYPDTILEFDVHRNNEHKLHPTQKPVELIEYLIKTYSIEGDLVLDNCAGSGTTAIAAENTNRRWICIEKSESYFNKAVERVENHHSKKNKLLRFL